MSTIVDTCGTSPSMSCAEPLATTSAARLDISPMPPTNGNINPANTTPASKQQTANRLTVTPVGRPSDMDPGYSRRPPDFGVLTKALPCSSQHESSNGKISSSNALPPTMTHGSGGPVLRATWDR